MTFTDQAVSVELEAVTEAGTQRLARDLSRQAVMVTAAVIFIAR